MLQREGAPDLLEKVITIYLADAPEILKALGAAAEKKKFQDIYQAAHKLKSSSGSVGALHLSSLLAEVERLGRGDRLEKLGEVLAQIGEEYEAVAKALKADNKERYVEKGPFYGAAFVLGIAITVVAFWNSIVNVLTHIKIP